MKKKRKTSHDSPPNPSRRKFLRGFGVTSVGAVAAGHGLLGSLEACSVEGSAPGVLGPGTFDLTLEVNGKKQTVRTKPQTTLAEVLRDELKLTGTKIGCDRGACGACTVLIDGKTVCSCMTLAADAAGRRVVTIEGVADDRSLHPIQEAFIETDALQCGFCTPGMILSCKSLLDSNPSPSETEIRKAVSGNLCRCGTYPKVIEAVKRVLHKKS